MYQIFVLLLFIFISVQADIAVTAEARKGLYLTVYKNFGIVKDSRNVDLPKGVNKIRFEGVAAGINSNSVFLEWPENVKIELLSQCYEFDLVSPAKLLEKYVGKQLEIAPFRGTGTDTATQTAELISIHGEEPVFRIGTQITFGNIGQLMFPYMPDNLYTKPTLIWEIEAAQRQNVELAASYLTEGITWDAGYVVYIDKKETGGSFAGWISFDNQSGFDYRDARVTFAAGDVHRVSSAPQRHGRLTSHDIAGQTGDLYLYTVNRALTITDNQVRQVEWIPKVKIRIRQITCVDYGDTDTGTGANEPVAVRSAIEIENSESNGLGMPLPPGIVRVFRIDGNANNWFVGEDRLEDTPVKKSFLVRTVTVNDIRASRKLEVRRKGDNTEEVRQITLTNNRNKDVLLRVRDNIGGKARLLNSSQAFSRIDGPRVEWDLTIKANQTHTLSFTVQTRG
jgi:hypothetical protein